MFFIMGITEGRKRFEQLFSIICPACGNAGRAVVYMTYTCLSLFFIPVFKWNRQYYVEMECCGTLFMLNEENIEHYILTISQYVDTNYYHEFIIAFTEDKQFLIDPTFGQFINNGTKLIKFLAWPGDVLKTKENGEKFTEELLNQGLYEVTESDVKSYLSSFDITKQNEDIDFSFQKLRKVNNK